MLYKQTTLILENFHQFDKASRPEQQAIYYEIALLWTWILRAGISNCIWSSKLEDWARHCYHRSFYASTVFPLCSLFASLFMLPSFRHVSPRSVWQTGHAAHVRRGPNGVTKASFLQPPQPSVFKPWLPLDLRPLALSDTALLAGDLDNGAGPASSLQADKPSSSHGTTNASQRLSGTVADSTAAKV